MQTQKLTKHFSLNYFPVTNGYRIELESKERTSLIPLLVTERQIKICSEILRKINFKSFSYYIVQMIVSGCFVTIMQRQ